MQPAAVPDRSGLIRWYPWTADSDDRAGSRPRCAAIADSDAILIGAGAGMGVDSGLPDFRGEPWVLAGLSAVRAAGARLCLAGEPALVCRGSRAGLGLLRTPDGALPPDHASPGVRDSAGLGRPKARRGGFVFTSNVDGHFQRSGFAPEQIVEVHGSFDGMQCTSDCGVGIFPGEPIRVEIDPETMRAVPRLPECPRCGALARPNILMFGDFGWKSTRTDAQMRRLGSWLGALGGAKLVDRRVRGRAGSPDGAHDL